MFTETTGECPASNCCHPLGRVGERKIAYALSHWHAWRNPSFRVAAYDGLSGSNPV